MEKKKEKENITTHIISIIRLLEKGRTQHNKNTSLFGMKIITGTKDQHIGGDKCHNNNTLGWNFLWDR